MTSKRTQLPDWIVAGVAIVLLVKAVIPVGRPSATITTVSQTETKVETEHWRAALSQGALMYGHPLGADTLVEFVDFECPACRAFAVSVDSLLLLDVTRQTTLFIHHFPLPHHRFAIPAAIVAECADRQGRFGEMYQILFTKQDSLGLKSWTSYATEAELPDLAEFGKCHRLPSDSFPRIAKGIELGKKAGVRGTPAVWIDGKSRSWSDVVQLLSQRLKSGNGAR